MNFELPLRRFRCTPLTVNNRLLALWLAALGAYAFAATSVLAQGYFIAWYKIAGGGGTSTGGGFTLNGTIGQHDAGARMTGGQYSLAGGFWPGIGLVQSPEAPLLSIVNIGANAVKVFWPSPSTGWVLQQNTDPSTTNWVNNALTVSDDGDNRWVTLTQPTGKLFLRLRKP